jgi:hypothetical protein
MACIITQATAHAHLMPHVMSMLYHIGSAWLMTQDCVVHDSGLREDDCLAELCAFIQNLQVQGLHAAARGGRRLRSLRK